MTWKYNVLPPVSSESWSRGLVTIFRRFQGGPAVCGGFPRATFLDALTYEIEGNGRKVDIKVLVDYDEIECPPRLHSAYYLTLPPLLSPFGSLLVVCI